MNKLFTSLSVVLLLWSKLEQSVFSLKEFSLGRYRDVAVYANNSVINLHLVGEGFEGIQVTDGGALECYTDDPTCCRGIDNPDGPGRGEWYFPDGSPLLPPTSNSSVYRTRDNMVIRLNRGSFIPQTGMYRCEIPGAGGVNITRYITLENSGDYCGDLADFSNGDILYYPPRGVSTLLPPGQRYIGTIAQYECSEGYELVGEIVQRACESNANWNGTEPFCEIVDCGSLTNPENGQVDTSSGTTFGSTATYTCDTGYALSAAGSQSRTCGADGNWTSSEPSCEIIDCGPISDPENGQVDISSGTIFGRVATFSCDLGYMLSHQQVVMCGIDGTWSPSIPTCPVTDCGLLADPTNGQVDTSSGTTFESTATYTCDIGYTLSGSQSRTCGANGMWTLSEPSCDAVDCGSLSDPVNGQVDTSSGTTFGSAATYTCDTGYTLSGSQSRTCGADRAWTLSEPLCEVIDCGSLAGPTYGQVDTSSGTTFGSVATFSCNTGYILSHQQVVTCGADEMWSPDSPSCLVIDCGPLTDPDNGQVDTSSGTTFESTATYTCDTGYTLSGSQSRTCGTDEMWTSSDPSCETIDCGPLTDPDNGQVNVSETTFGSTANYTCDTGYTLSSLEASTITCGADEVWSSIPTCERVIIQIRFGQLNCVNYVSSDASQNIENILMSMMSSIEQLCSCEIDADNFLSSQLQCFDPSPQSVNFRTQLSGDTQTSTSELLSHIEQWIGSMEQFVVDGVGLTLNTSCPLLITSFDVDECPGPSTPSTDTLPAGSGGISGILIACVILGVLLLVSLACNILLIACVILSRGKKESYVFREQDNPMYSDINDNLGKRNGPDMSLTYENVGGASVKEADLNGADIPPTVNSYEIPRKLRSNSEIFTNMAATADPKNVGGEYEDIEKYQENSTSSLLSEQSRARSSSYKVANCPVYAPVDIRKP